MSDVVTLVPRPASNGGRRADLRRLSMPQIRRASMVPARMDRHPLKRIGARVRAWLSGNGAAHAAAAPCASFTSWRRAARRRRIGLAVLVLAQTALAAWLLERTFPYPSRTGLEIATLGVFTVLWSWISLGFWTAVA